MGLIKSKQEREIERRIKIRKAQNTIAKQVKTLEANERKYIDKAKRAKRLGDGRQVAFLKNALRRTMNQKIFMERQLLNFETIVQIKDQMTAHAEFAKAMTAISKSIAASFSTTNLGKVMKDFEKAMVQAETLEEKMGAFQEMTTDALMEAVPGEAEGLVSDKDIEAMIEGEAVHDEEQEIDKEIEAGLAEVKKELEHR